MSDCRNALLAIFALCCVFHEGTCTLSTDELKPLPTRTNYSASGADYDDGGMGPLYNFARSFINTALSGGFPTTFVNDTLKSYKDGKFGVDNIKGMLSLFKGYVAAIAVGVLFIVVFPVVGTCFCCCRLCGNCGGSRKQEVSKNMHMKRRVFGAVLFVLTTFTLVGNICTYVSNGRMSVALGEIGDTVENNLDDIDSYLNLVQEQVETIGIHNLGVTKTGIVNLMDPTKLKEEITVYVLDSLSNGSLTKMQTHITATAKAFKDLIQSRDTINAVTSTWPVNPLGDASFSLLDAKKQQFDQFATFNVVEKVKTEVTGKINSLDLTAQKKQVTDAFAQIEPQITNVVDQIKKFRSNADDGMDLASYKRKARSLTDTSKKYDNYRYSAAAGLAGITTLVIALQFLGLAFGTIGQGWKTEPDNRGCVTNAGGQFLMASVGFIFLFSSLLMLLTTLCFSLGAILERFVCQPLSDDNLQLLKIADPYVPTRSALNADLSDILKDCRSDKSAYIAFHLKSKFDLATLDKTMDDQKLEIDQSLQGALGKIGNIGGVNFGSIGIGSQLSNFQNSLSSMNFVDMKTQIQQMMNSPLLAGPTGAAVRDAMNTMVSAIDTLAYESTVIGNLNQQFNSGMSNAQSNIAGSMTKLMDDFKKKIINVAEVFVNATKHDIKYDMGRCSPVWNLYESILVVAVCKYTVDAFNGFWFSIGWCLFFFVPSAIFSVKLAKHYRTMNAGNGHGLNLDRESSFGYDSPVHRRNKVGHSDEEHINGY